MSDLDIPLLRALVAVADSGGFGAAAKRLHRTQGAVSMQIQKLEAVTGRRLFERDTRSVRPTEDGERLLRRARRVLAEHDEALAELRAAVVEGKVRLGTPDDYATCFLPEPLARFAAAHPRVEIEVRCDLSADLLAAVDQGELDLALLTRSAGGLRTPGLDGETGELVRREPLVWAAARDRDVHLADPLPLVLFPRGCLFREAVGVALGESERSWRVAYSSPSIAGLRAAVLGGLGVTVLAQSTLTPDLRVLGAEHGLPALPAVEIVLVRARRRASPAVAGLAQHLMQSLRLPLAAAAAAAAAA